MFNTLKHASARGALLAAALFATAAGAFAQAPTEAQKSAIRSACRSDFIAHCSSVTPGGVEAYQCLQKNMSGLSSGCQTAVRAVEPAAAPKAEAAPKTEAAPKEAAPKAETAPAAPKAESAPAAKPAAAAAPEGEPRPRRKARCRGRAQGCCSRRCGQAAEQRAGRRRQERVPGRLSPGVRQRPAGRRARARMPGEEQGKGFAGLREGRERRGRRWRGSNGGTCGRRSCTGSRACRDRAAPAAATRRAVH